eukprot:CAMPEP_0172670140 /NCGR_PEP_ID=MMETSP1074-20121228/10119_1 /TAXON_ID=2916 /ORGANISM="Ceratium fusus, Strain PA161109" /LENGTH=147 /DNA_ID=CAMNT_0013487011 /DNA_START=178 /DNA_END=621 /DNA_ORIENTATION=+
MLGYPSNFDPGPSGSRRHLEQRELSLDKHSPDKQHCAASPDTGKPPMPRGTERSRMPPPTGSRRNSDLGDDGFDADSFAAPDSARSDLAAPGRMQQPAALSVLEQEWSDDSLFPEIVPISKRFAANACRDAAMVTHSSEETLLEAVM